MLRAFFFAAVLTVSFSAQAGQVEKLSSGDTVEITAISPLKSTSEGWTALVLSYQSKTPLSDLDKLHREADEVWDRFVHDVERANFKNAIISASQDGQPQDAPPAGQPRRVYNFAYQKHADAWRNIDFKPGTDAKLDEASVRAAIARFDAAIEHDQINAALLYLGDDWTFTLNMTVDGNNVSRTARRINFASMTAQSLARIKDFQHARKIVKLTIAPDGKSAEIVSEEAETGTIGNKPVKQIEHTVDKIAIEGASIVLTQTISDETDG